MLQSIPEDLYVDIQYIRNGEYCHRTVSSLACDTPEEFWDHLLYHVVDVSCLPGFQSRDVTLHVLSY